MQRHLPIAPLWRRRLLNAADGGMRTQLRRHSRNRSRNGAMLDHNAGDQHDDHHNSRNLADAVRTDCARDHGRDRDAHDHVVAAAVSGDAWTA